MTFVLDKEHGVIDFNVNTIVLYSPKENCDKDKNQETTVTAAASHVETPSQTTFEDLLALTGGFGVFQGLILITLLFPEIPASFVAFAPIFVGRQPEKWMCYISNGTGNITIIAETLKEHCGCAGTLVPYPPSLSSIVTEWNFCNETLTSDGITSIQMGGMLTGSIFTSQLSDWYGRKRTYIGVCLLMALGQCISAVAPSPIVYAVARFFGGAGLSGFMGVSTIYPMEFLTPKWRLLCGSVGPWGPGIVLISLLAYYLRSWRRFLWTTAIPFITVIIFVPFIPESPRWLLRNQRIEEAENVFKTIHRINRKWKETSNDSKITRELLEAVAKNESQGEHLRFTYYQFCRRADLRNKSLFLMGIWFSWALVYFGISYNINNIKGDPYLNVALLGAADTFGYPFALFLNNRIGRRKSLIALMSLGAVFLILLAGLDLIYGLELNVWTVGILCLLGKFGVAGARSSARCLTGESFPTPVRTMGYGISGITAGVGGIIAPMLAYYGTQWWHPLPFVTFAAISFGGSTFSLLLSETADKTLEDHVVTENGHRAQLSGVNNLTSQAGLVKHAI